MLNSKKFVLLSGIKLMSWRSAEMWLPAVTQFELTIKGPYKLAKQVRL